MNTFKITDEKLELSGKLVAVDPCLIMTATDWAEFSETIEEFIKGDKEIAEDIVCQVDKTKFYVSPPLFEEGACPVIDIQTEDEQGIVEISSNFFVVIPLVNPIVTTAMIAKLVERGQATLLYIKEPVQPEILDTKGVVIQPYRIAPLSPYEQPLSDIGDELIGALDDINLADVEDENAAFPFDRDR